MAKNKNQMKRSCGIIHSSGICPSSFMTIQRLPEKSKNMPKINNLYKTLNHRKFFQQKQVVRSQLELPSGHQDPEKTDLMVGFFSSAFSRIKPMAASATRPLWDFSLEHRQSRCQPPRWILRGLARSHRYCANSGYCRTCGAALAANTGNAGASHRVVCFAGEPAPTANPASR